MATRWILINFNFPTLHSRKGRMSASRSFFLCATVKPVTLWGFHGPKRDSLLWNVQKEDLLREIKAHVAEAFRAFPKDPVCFLLDHAFDYWEDISR
ncbi:hypothetical protein AVEN_75359-1 [Araneus ventricosus]|uniref:Uncharacterized protein n=1 Tax=Araneus ventricosus TaxID=182803 RepID=A0A4Y2SUE4_ARAVE|nr:hypothetical protein AVEN_75359-1 [Araneus ventricosus]